MLTLDLSPSMVGAETGFRATGGGEVAERPPLLPATVTAALASPGLCSGVVRGLVRKSGEERSGWATELRPEVTSPGASGGADVERTPWYRFAGDGVTRWCTGGAGLLQGSGKGWSSSVAAEIEGPQGITATALGSSPAEGKTDTMAVTWVLSDK